MQYSEFLNSGCLKEGFHAALKEQRNIVLQACSQQNDILDFARSVSSGLALQPRKLECRFLYDAAGSELYERICQQPEYYLTRTEAGILRRQANAIAERTGQCHLIELGSGSSSKTDYLIRAYQALYGSVRYSPIDVSASALQAAGQVIIDTRPQVQVVGIHGTYADSFPLLGSVSPTLVMFLGSTIGNLTPLEEWGFWKEIASNLMPGDYFLLGVDLVKDVRILEAAYNDAAGVTAEFTKNYFARMNRELGCALDIGAIEHLAYYDTAGDRMEIYATFNTEQIIDIDLAGQAFRIGRGEQILVEISRKFRLDQVQQSVEPHGFATVDFYTDEKEWFGLLLLRKVSQSPQWSQCHSSGKNYVT